MKKAKIIFVQKSVSTNFNISHTFPCTWCETLFFRTLLQNRENNFCCNDHRKQWWRKHTIDVVNVPGHGKGTKRPHLSALNKIRNKTNNPMWNPETSKKVGDILRDRGEGKTYRKLNNRHEHHVVAEQILGRALNTEEVVHHIDGNKRNNSPENLMICESQAEHARIHFSKKGGGVN